MTAQQLVATAWPRAAARGAARPPRVAADAPLALRHPPSPAVAPVPTTDGPQCWRARTSASVLLRILRGAANSESEADGASHTINAVEEAAAAFELAAVGEARLWEWLLRQIVVPGGALAGAGSGEALCTRVPPVLDVRAARHLAALTLAASDARP